LPAGGAVAERRDVGGAGAVAVAQIPGAGRRVEGADGRDRARRGRGRRRQDGERAVHEGDGVVPRGGPGGVGRVAARAAGGGRVRRQRHRDGQAGRGVAVNEPLVAGRERRQRAALGHGYVNRGDGERGRGDRQLPGGVGDNVIGVGRPADVD